MNSTSASIQECFADLSDPRMEGKVHHKLLDLIVLTLCAVLCGADTWVDVEAYGYAKREWFETFLELPNGIPSHDTFGRVFALIAPAELEACFVKWVQAVAQVMEGEVVAIDGKTLRRSYDSASDQAAIHMVSAWATANSMVLGQLKTQAKSNEITAIPELLKVLELKGCIVTIDAMGCQKEIAAQIVDAGADYVLALKGNQGSLHEAVRERLEEARREPQQEENSRELHPDYHESSQKGHGRLETRRCWVLPAEEGLPGYQDWKSLTTLALVESERCVGNKTTVECRYYISSVDGGAEQLAAAVRQHWGIENRLHWVLDIAFREDESRVRNGHAAENLAILRRLSLNLLKQEKSAKIGTKAKRLRAGWDNDYLLKVLSV